MQGSSERERLGTNRIERANEREGWQVPRKREREREARPQRESNRQ